MDKAIDLGRRHFIVATAATGGGLALGFSPFAAADAAEADAGEMPEFNPWLVIGADDTVTVRVTTPEIGNGAPTQIAMTITEELQCAFAR